MNGLSLILTILGIVAAALAAGNALPQATVVLLLAILIALIQILAKLNEK